jgi:predicted PhzF superfamily epimerase YddE/YHI9
MPRNRRSGSISSPGEQVPRVGILKSRSYLTSQGRYVGRDAPSAVEFEDDTIWLGGHAVTRIEGSLKI